MDNVKNIGLNRKKSVSKIVRLSKKKVFKTSKDCYTLDSFDNTVVLDLSDANDFERKILSRKYHSDE